MKTSRSPRPASPTRTSSAFGYENAWSSRCRVAIATLAVPIIVRERRPGDVTLARKPRGEPAGHREPEGIVERGVRDAGIVQPPSRRGPEPVHAGRECLQRAIDELESLRVIGIRLEKAERLVQAEEGPGVTDRAPLELGEERTLSLLILGSVTGGGRCESLDEAAAAGFSYVGGSERPPSPAAFGVARVRNPQCAPWSRRRGRSSDRARARPCRAPAPPSRPRRRSLPRSVPDRS